jgi:poly-gamma-glutamate capsule biosynthesis protein CapA/YwtB (metallophosphatase superfamily)
MRLLLVGDIMLGRLVDRRLRSEAPAYIWGDTLPLFEAADCRICNLECTIAAHPGPPPQPKMFRFVSAAANVGVLRAAHIDAVSIANNHALDGGRRAVVEMVGILDAAGIAHAGAGADAAAARRPALVERGGMRIALVACTDNEPAWEAHHQQPGVFHVPADVDDSRARALLGCVWAAHGPADLVVVSLHWGSNWGRCPPVEHRVLAHALIDAGADVVYGHSAHVLRGIEVYRGRPILYGTGDFVDDYAVDPVERNDESAVFVVETEAATPCRVLMYPTVIVAQQAQCATGGQAARIAGRVAHLCSLLETEAHRTGGLMEVSIRAPASRNAQRSPDVAAR